MSQRRQKGSKKNSKLTQVSSPSNVFSSSVSSSTGSESQHFDFVQKQSSFPNTDYFRKWAEYESQPRTPMTPTDRYSLYTKIGSASLNIIFSSETVLLVLDYLYMPDCVNVSAITKCEVCDTEVVGHTKYVENVLADPHNHRNEETKIKHSTQVLTKIINNYDILARIMLFLKMDIVSMVGFIGSLNHGFRVESTKIASCFGLTNTDMSYIFSNSLIIDQMQIPVPVFQRLPVLSKIQESEKKDKMYYPCTRCMEERISVDNYVECVA